MNSKHNSTASHLIRRLLGQATVFAISIGFVAFVWVDRSEVFQRLRYPLLDGELAVPYGWATAALVLLLFLVRQSSAGSRILRMMHLGLAGLILTIVVGLLCGQNSWVQYQVYRWETFGPHYHVSANDRAGTESRLVDKISESGVAKPGIAKPGIAKPGIAKPGIAKPGVAKPGIARWIQQDAQMLAHLAENRGNLFARNPDAARITLTSLIATGTTLDDLLGRSNCETFLLYALAGEMYVEPSEKNWAEPLATSFLRRQTQAIDSTSHDELEALFFCVANRSDTIDQQDLLRVRSTWMERVPQFESLLAEGIRLGETINQRLADNKIDAIRFSMKEGYQLPYAAKQKGVVQAMKRSVETLIQLTRKTGIEFADASDSLEITLKLEGEPIDEYRKQILEWRSQYKTKGFRSLKTGTWYRSGSWVDRAVPSGESRIERVLGQPFLWTYRLSAIPSKQVQRWPIGRIFLATKRMTR